MTSTMKKLVGFLLAIVMILGTLPGVVYAADYVPTKMEKATAIADILYEAKLFAGIGNDAQGKPIYALEGNATRAQAIVMLVRIIGKEAESKNSPQSPFTDVPQWTAPAVNYGYANGLTSGVGGGKYGSNYNVTITQYVSFGLRALGYTAQDFAWNNAPAFAESLGILPKGDYPTPEAVATRADMVIITYAVLNTRVKGSNKTLAETNGVVLGQPQYPTSKPLPAVVQKVKDEWTAVPAGDMYDRTNSNYWFDHHDGTYTFSPKVLVPALSNYNFQDSSKSLRERLEGYIKLFGSFGPVNQCYTTVDDYYSVDNELHGVAQKQLGIGYTTIEGKDYWFFPFMSPTLWKTYEEMEDSIVYTEGELSEDSNIFRMRAIQAMYTFDENMVWQTMLMMDDYHLNTRARMWTEVLKDGRWVDVFNDECLPITRDFAARYGLELISDVETNEYNGEGYFNIATVSNGNQTWVIKYRPANRAFPRYSQDTDFVILVPTE